MPIDKTYKPEPTAYHLFPTVFGTCGIAWNETGLCRVQLPDRDEAGTERRVARGDVARASELPELALSVIASLNRYFSGERLDFTDVPLDFDGVGEFETSIYKVLRHVAYGRTTTYGALAKSVGSPDAARAVGMAMGRNPWPVVVPCHRVLGANQAMTGFSAPGGISTKQKLLRLEGAGGAEQLSLFE